ncbi:PD-(D/E)XK nuclease family protein [Diaphorobacter aerolatus]|uniref:PD-(D/E)XK nuclease family protein n=1 Tax=Diaphorobacter aerolatus TaxID=1288495 RepID=A0A7H0GK42_9BURK|nr:PD-(D/E)XK nuclease family protein [Diaphorobacter aerolatus]QNP48658.1 PD-(D/E)XK nuclease family protein [Diaphorobacter aerolatus]
MTSSAVYVPASLVLVLWLVRRWRRRHGYGERASRPRELANAELIYMEKLFRIEEPIRLVAKVDRVYRLSRGSLVLVELKTRSSNRAYPSDIIQLSAQKAAVEHQTGEAVEPVGFVTVLDPTSGRRRQSHQVQLLDEGQLIEVAQRRRAILERRTDPAYAHSVRACAGCAFHGRCDRPA